MTDVDHDGLMSGLASAIRDHRWEALGDFFRPDAVLEYPQSGERFSGLANIRAQFANYPDLEPGTTELDEVISGTTYALTEMYTVIIVEGSGNRGIAILRARYPDGSRWWILNVYELRDGLIARSRNFFAPEFAAPDWRLPFSDQV